MCCYLSAVMCRRQTAPAHLPPILHLWRAFPRMLVTVEIFTTETQQEIINQSNIFRGNQRAFTNTPRILPESPNHIQVTPAAIYHNMETMWLRQSPSVHEVSGNCTNTAPTPLPLHCSSVGVCPLFAVETHLGTP